MPSAASSSPVGERTGGHDAPLGDELGRRRRDRELVPELFHAPPPSLRAVAVHEDRVLLDGVGELDERLELLRRGAVVADAVLRDAAQLAHTRRVGERLTDGTCE